MEINICVFWTELQYNIFEMKLLKVRQKICIFLKLFQMGGGKKPASY